MKAIFLLLTVCAAFVQNAPSDETNLTKILGGFEQVKDNYELPKLPFKYGDMEPWIDAKTMKAHHEGIHSVYAARMNAILKKWKKSGEEKELANSSLLNILKNMKKVPAKWREDLRLNIGGYVNHNFYFATMGANPKNKEKSLPSTLSSIIHSSFQNYSEFHEWMTKEAIELQCSGYVWLCREPNRNYLTVYPTHEENSPISSGIQPLLGIDLWEHAYYIKHQYRRKDYIRSWWKTVNWDKVEQILQWWKKFDPKREEL